MIVLIIVCAAVTVCECVEGVGLEGPDSPVQQATYHQEILRVAHSSLYIATIVKNK